MAASVDAAGDISTLSTVRNSLGTPEAIRAARGGSMSERLELALSWNAVAAELRAELAAAAVPAKRRW